MTIASRSPKITIYNISGSWSLLYLLIHWMPTITVICIVSGGSKDQDFWYCFELSGSGHIKNWYGSFLKSSLGFESWKLIWTGRYWSVWISMIRFSWIRLGSYSSIFQWSLLESREKNIFFLIYRDQYSYWYDILGYHEFEFPNRFRDQ